MRKPYEKSTNYFVLSMNDKNNKDQVRFSVWAVNPDMAAELVSDYADKIKVHVPEGSYTLRVRKIRVRDKIDHKIPTYQS